MNKVPVELLNALMMMSHFLLVVHHKPDGDAIGSIIAFGKMLKKMGKDVDYYVEWPVEDKLRFFPEAKYFNPTLSDHYDALVYLDCSTADYAHKPEFLPKTDKTIVIDHHCSNARYCDINFVEETAATGELVFRIMRALKIEPDDEMVDAIFTAITTDTGSFQFSNVTAQTHQIISELYHYRDDFAVLSKKLHQEKSYDQMKMYGEAIHTLTLLENDKIAWSFLSESVIKQCGGSNNITDDISNIGVNILGVMVSVLIKEQESGDYRVSFRSKSPYPIDVSVISKKYGGGGHFRAGGCTFSGDLDELKQEVIALVRQQGDCDAL